MRRIRSIAFFLTSLAVLLSHAGCKTERISGLPVVGDPSQRILFVGNSYTFYNGGLDRVLMEMARQRGREIACIASTSPGKSLEWHWNEGNAQEFIVHSNADWVVLQDYSLQPLNKLPLMSQYIRQFDEEIKHAGAKTALYMTWARQNQPENQKTITDAYTSIGKEIGAKVVPCGVAWQRVMRERPDITLYRGDNSHPTAEGTYLNACCFYAALLGDDPRGLPPPLINEETLPPRRLSDDVTKFLQRIAWETVATPVEKIAS